MPRQYDENSRPHAPNDRRPQHRGLRITFTETTGQPEEFAGGSFSHGNAKNRWE